MEEIDRTKKAVVRCSKLQDDGPPAGFKNAGNFAQALLPINHVADTKGDGKPVEDSTRMGHGFTGGIQMIGNFDKLDNLYLKTCR